MNCLHGEMTNYSMAEEEYVGVAKPALGSSAVKEITTRNIRTATDRGETWPLTDQRSRAMDQVCVVLLAIPLRVNFPYAGES